MIAQELNALLATLGRSLGIPALAADESGYCCLCIDKTLIVNVQGDESTGMLQLFAELGSPGPGTDNGIFRQLLDANVLWRGTGGATLGFDSTRQTVTIMYQEPLRGLSDRRFEQILEGFIQSAEYWRGKIQTGDYLPPTQGSGPFEDTGGMMRV